MRVVRTLPLLLTALRAALAPAVVLLALYRPSPPALGACLVAAFLSDIFDGIVARRLNVVTPNLRRLDSAADTLFYLGAAFAVWRLHPGVLEGQWLPLGTLAALELARYALDFAKFGREASYHMWSSKLWGVTLFGACFAILAAELPASLPVSIAIYAGILADLEGLAISLVLREWRADVPTVLHALEIRRAARRDALA